MKRVRAAGDDGADATDLPQSITSTQRDAAYREMATKGIIKAPDNVGRMYTMTAGLLDDETRKQLVYCGHGVLDTIFERVVPDIPEAVVHRFLHFWMGPMAAADAPQFPPNDAQSDVVASDRFVETQKYLIKQLQKHDAQAPGSLAAATKTMFTKHYIPQTDLPHSLNTAGSRSMPRVFTVQLADAETRTVADDAPLAIVKSQALSMAPAWAGRLDVYAQKQDDDTKYNVFVDIPPIALTREYILGKEIERVLLLERPYIVSPHFATPIDAFVGIDYVTPPAAATWEQEGLRWPVMPPNTAPALALYTVSERADRTMFTHLNELMDGKKRISAERAKAVCAKVAMTIQAMEALMLCGGSENDHHPGNVMIRDVEAPSVYAGCDWVYRLLGGRLIRIPAAVHRNEFIEIIDFNRATFIPTATRPASFDEAAVSAKARAAFRGTYDELPAAQAYAADAPYEALRELALMHVFAYQVCNMLNGVYTLLNKKKKFSRIGKLADLYKLYRHWNGMQGELPDWSSHAFFKDVLEPVNFDVLAATAAKQPRTSAESVARPLLPVLVGHVDDDMHFWHLRAHYNAKFPDKAIPLPPNAPSQSQQQPSTAVAATVMSCSACGRPAATVLETTGTPICSGVCRAVHLGHLIPLRSRLGHPTRDRA